ncbi:MAG: TerC family protein [Hyphomicrobiaceae bacterium]
MLDWLMTNWNALWQIIVIDVVLAGDNAIVVGLAASQVAPQLRKKVIFWGIAGAVVLRILFASITNQLLAIVGLTLAGGILLLWVCWKMYRQLKDDHLSELEQAEAGLSGSDAAVVGASAGAASVAFWPAVGQIVVADVSMSLDNVLAVAGAAKGETLVLVLGLAVAIILMAVASTYIAKLLVKYPWITWIGLFIILYVALDMIYRGTAEVACEFQKVGCDGLWQWMVGVIKPS